MATAQVNTRTQRLPPRSEYRFELEQGERISLRLIPGSGDAEIFGAEMVAGEKFYAFGDESRVAVSSWKGAELEVAGTASTEYLADEPSPTYTSYANLHLLLEKHRLQARSFLRSNPAFLSTLSASPSVLNPPAPRSPTDDAQGGSGDAEGAYRPEGQGPRVLVLGPESAGKTTLVKFLANYALRSPAVCSLGKASEQKEREKETEEGDEKEKSKLTGWWPVVVNLDPSEGAAPLPCSLAALPLSPLPLASLPSPSPAFPFGTSISTTGAVPPTPSTAHLVAPLTMWLGKENVRENERHAKRVVDWLAEGLERRLARDARARMSGLLIDTPGVTSADGRGRYAFIQHCVRAFKVDTIVVLGHEKLNIEMTRIFGSGTSAPGQAGGVTVLKLPKSGGVVELDDTYKARLRALQVRSYFYGGSTQSQAQAASAADADGSTGSAADSKAALPVVTLPGHAEPLGGLPALSPFSMTVSFDALDVYRIGQESMAPSSALPIGASRTVTETQLVKLDPANSASDQASLLHSIIALVQTPSSGTAKADPNAGTGTGENGGQIYADDELIGSPVVGYLHIADIDAVRKKFTVLSPSQGRLLPSRTALLGSLDWTDA